MCVDQQTPVDDFHTNEVCRFPCAPAAKLLLQVGAQRRQNAKLFLQSFELGFPHPLARRRVSSPLWFPGKGHTRFRDRGWGSPNSNEGTYTVVLSRYLLDKCLFRAVFRICGVFIRIWFWGSVSLEYGFRGYPDSYPAFLLSLSRCRQTICFFLVNLFVFIHRYIYIIILCTVFT
jgi:hypothetical protein